MADSWDERRRAAEEQYFSRQNAAAMERLKSRSDKPRLSPITGEPMEQITVMGVVIDRCPASHGVWLDAGELDQILEASKKADAGEGFLASLFSGFKDKQKS